MTLMPRESAKFIANLSKHVLIENSGIKNIASKIVENLQNGKISISNFSESEYHPKEKDPKAADWIFVLDTLNFSFWSDCSEKRWTVNGESGYVALAAAIKRAVDKGIPITDAKYYSKITSVELENILKGDTNSGEIPLLQERVRNLNSVGEVLLKKYNGTFLDCIASSNNSSERLLKIVVKDFECYRDEAEYHGQRVSFYKRAQILVADIWACFKGKGYGFFNDIDSITMFADYRVPQVLVHFGALKYSDELLKKLKAETALKPGSIEEVELRGCSVEAVELVDKEVKSILKEQLLPSNLHCNPVLIDYFLWDFRRQHASELEYIPYHKVRTIYY